MTMGAGTALTRDDPQAASGAASGQAGAAAGDAVLVGEGLTKVFAGFAAVKNVNLSIRRGSIHALIGPNGAGKTTCFNLLTKTLTPTSGRVIFDGQDVSALRSSEVARRGLVRSFQISATFPNLTALENVRVALQSRFGMAYHFWRSLRAVAPLNRRAEELLEQVGLADSRHIAASDLSYGKKRALEIATTLALEPKVLLLDEPTAGMGHEDIAPITALIRAAAVGRTVLLVEHNLSVVSDLCDRITVLQHGQVLAEGSYQQVSGNPDVISAYMGGVDD
ncbi:amino acid ABC transporter ATP-binding protein [Afipia sp. P52-10]|jgi:branched-chain amino acid transport system ATP-binding protein|uniref:ABC transporter ATP-binding protein n=1 Tax=Afipia sp. P52-10 TaxID=1429916 RepID=UPI0003DF3F09|nr:ABC transporter ATP-binding protein [Afipia sp. P52-10]ETR78299.1 amino acid ABC transporter ATP-binding protein [Afipia sp. P52-10]